MLGHCNIRYLDLSPRKAASLLIYPLIPPDVIWAIAHSRLMFFTDLGSG